MITIRSGEKKDIPAVLSLIKELALYENAAGEVLATIDSMEEDGFGNRKYFEFFVAEEAEEILGIAVYFHSYSTWKGRALYLDDLVVRENQRRRGIGKLLFDALVKKAKEIGAQRLSWQVLEWNEPAIEFYKKINTDFDPEWINCKLNAEQIINYK
jgi:GNAT superfamily N-acetyltransferase